MDRTTTMQVSRSACTVLPPTFSFLPLPFLLRLQCMIPCCEGVFSEVSHRPPGLRLELLRVLEDELPLLSSSLLILAHACLFRHLYHAIPSSVFMSSFVVSYLAKPH